jgi:Fur family ferric uptake transcriptional regulator
VNSRAAGARAQEFDEQLEGVIELLRSKGHRVTTPRRFIIRCLIEAGGHRTADELATEVHDLAPDVHISTIYRNLEELELLGIIEHAHLGHGAASYHLAALPHGHFVCSDCGKTIEVPDTLFSPLARRAKSVYGFTIDPHHFAMIGRCEDCSPPSE